MKIKNFHLDLFPVRQKFDQLKQQLDDDRKEAAETHDFTRVMASRNKVTGFIMGVEAMNVDDNNHAVNALTESFWKEIV